MTNVCVIVALDATISLNLFILRLDHAVFLKETRLIIPCHFPAAIFLCAFSFLIAQS